MKRRITRKIREAFSAAYAPEIDNTETNGSSIALHRSRGSTVRWKRVLVCALVFCFICLGIIFTADAVRDYYLSYDWKEVSLDQYLNMTSEHIVRLDLSGEYFAIEENGIAVAYAEKADIDGDLIEYLASLSGDYVLPQQFSQQIDTPESTTHEGIEVEYGKSEQGGITVYCFKYKIDGVNYYAKVQAVEGKTVEQYLSILIG